MIISQEVGLPPDKCPYSQGDKTEYEIWGEWGGPKASDNYGNNTGLQSIIIINRTQSLIAVYEEKDEKISGMIQGQSFEQDITMNSYWVYNTTTRTVRGFDSYTWMWIKINENGELNSQIKVYHYDFLVNGRREYEYRRQTRVAWVTTFINSFNDPSDSFYKNTFELWFDTHTGIMVYFVLRFQAFDFHGKITEWSYYSTKLILTTINMNQTYVLSSVSHSFEEVLIPIVLWGVMSIILIGVMIIRFKRPP